MVYKKRRPITQEWLKKNHFRCVKSWSSKEDGEAYESRYPLHKYNADTTIEVRIIIFPQTGECRIDILDANNYNASFAPWYNKEYGDSKPLIDIIENNLNKVLSKLEIKSYDNSRRKMRKLRVRENK